MAAIARVGVRTLPLPRLAALLARLPATRRSAETARDCALAAADAVQRAAHPTCLYSALTAFALLARRGYAPRLVIGGTRDGGFDAHAWVTVDGEPIVPSSRSYARLWSYGAPASGVR